jgi:hypothetical protein
MNENTCSNQSSILDQLRTIPEGKQVRFILRRPDGSEFTHVSAIGRQYAGYPNGFDTVDKEIALATPFDASKGDAYVNEFWVRWTNPGSGRCGIVAIEQLAPPLPDLETLRKWVADGTQVRIEYTHDVPTAERIGPSPVMCKLLRTGDNSYPGGCGLFVSVAADTGGGDWNLFFSPIIEGYARPRVTSITPVVEKAQTAEEIDAIMQRAAKSGAQVEVVTEIGVTYTNTVRYDGSDCHPYRMPAQGWDGVVKWLGVGATTRFPESRIVSVRELTPKQTEAEMLALLQQAEREGNHVEATMADGSNHIGAVTEVRLWGLGSDKTGTLVRCVIKDAGASFGARLDCERIAAVKLLPREEKRPMVQYCEPGTVTFSVVGPSVITTALGFSGPFSLAPGPTLDIKVEEKTHITPACCADVEPYIGRRVRVEDGIEGILTGCGIDPDDGEYWFGLDGETPNTEEPNDKCYAFTLDEGHWTFELLPDEPAPDNLMIEPKCSADLEPYLGRRVRVLAGSERELVREGILTHSTIGDDARWLGIDGAITWAYGPDRLRSTLVEVLPELPAIDDDETSIEDDSDDLEYDVSEVTGSIHVVESKLTLAELLAMAPPPSEVRAYEGSFATRA